MNDSHEKSSHSTSKNGKGSDNAIKTISLNIESNNSNNKNYEIKIDNKNDNSSFNKKLNKKIMKLLKRDHPLLPMKTIKKIANFNMIYQYFINKDFYNKKVIDEIIHNQTSHIVAEFKDYLIKGDINEFLQQFYKKEESLNLLPNIYDYYITCSVIFPNYVILPESQYIYKNIQRKQRVIDIQQEQEDKEENIKNGLIKQEKEPTIFTTQVFDSILNQTDTSGVKHYFGMNQEMSKGGEESDMLKLLKSIEKTEKKINININDTKNKINVCRLKKGNNNEVFHFQENVMLNEGGYSKKIQSKLQINNGTESFQRKNSSNNKELNKNKNSLKQILRQYAEINNFYKGNNFSTQITYIDSYNNHINNVFELKGLESIKKLKRKGNNLNKDKQNNLIKTLYKNNSQTFRSLKNLNLKGRNSYKYNFVNQNKDNSENYIINQNQNINQIKIKKNIHKNYSGRNNDYCQINSNTNIKTYIKEHLKNSNSNKNKKSITSYKTKSQNKNNSKGYQTSRNKYDNRNMYINISTNNEKSIAKKNHQSLDGDNNNFSKKRKVNQIYYNKNNKLKNNLIKVLLGSGKNIQRKKLNKYKNILIQKDINKSLVDSIELKDNKDNNNEQKINNENDNNSGINNNEKDYPQNNKNIFLYNIDKYNSQSNRIISVSNLDSNNKFSSSSCTKTMSINSYRVKPKYSNSYKNTINHKKQISMSKIPTNFPDNKILNNNKNKKINKIDKHTDIKNKNKIKNFIDNYLEDFSSLKTNNNFNNTQPKSFQKENNNYSRFDKFNSNNTNYYIEEKYKTKNIKKSQNILMSEKSHQEEKREIKSIKIRNSIYNFEKTMYKKLSEKKFNLYDKFRLKNSPKKGITKKAYSIHSNKSINIQNSDHAPLSAKEVNSKFRINVEIIELLSNKIQKIKQSLKNSDKGLNSISSIFKKKKIISTGKKIMIPNIKKEEEFIEKKTKIFSKTRNLNNNNGLIGTNSSNSSRGNNYNLVNTIVNSIYQTNLLSPNKKNIEYEKLIKNFQKFKKPASISSANKNNNKLNNTKNNYNNNNIIKNYSKKVSQRKKNQERRSSIYDSHNNYEKHINIEVKIKNNLKVHSKKSSINGNKDSIKQKKNQKDNNKNINFNNKNNNKTNKSNIRNINFNNTNNNTIMNKIKSSSLKVIMDKAIDKKKNNFKGIPIHGFDKLISKKYNTRNYNIPMSVTDRLKQSNIYSSSNTNANTYRYKNSSNKNINNYAGFYQKK